MRIMITGGRGLLGRSLSAGLSGWAKAGGHTIAALCRDEADVTDARSLTRAFRDHGPEAVLNCAAVSSPADCERDRDLAFSVNNLGCATLAHACRVHGARLIHFSTARVFGGEDRPHSEFDSVEETDETYGQSKWAGECAIRLCCASHVIFRLSWFYGHGKDGLLGGLLERARQGEGPLTVPVDRLGSPASAAAVARVVAAVLDRPHVVGTYHLGSAGETSLYGFTRAALQLAGVGRAVDPGMAATATPGLPLPASARLESRLLAIRGLPAMPGWREDLEAFMTGACPEARP